MVERRVPLRVEMMCKREGLCSCAPLCNLGQPLRAEGSLRVDEESLALTAASIGRQLKKEQAAAAKEQDVERSGISSGRR